MKLTDSQNYSEAELEPEVFESYHENPSSAMATFEFEFPDGDGATIDLSHLLEGNSLASDVESSASSEAETRLACGQSGTRGNDSEILTPLLEVTSDPTDTSSSECLPSPSYGMQLSHSTASPYSTNKKPYRLEYQPEYGPLYQTLNVR